MNQNEFVEQLKRLEGAFEKKYTKEKAERVWFYVKELPARNFHHICNHFIDNHVWLPKPGEFKEAAIAERNSIAMEQLPKLSAGKKHSGGLEMILKKMGCMDLRGN